MQVCSFYIVKHFRGRNLSKSILSTLGRVHQRSSWPSLLHSARRSPTQVSWVMPDGHSDCASLSVSPLAITTNIPPLYEFYSRVRVLE